MSKKSQIRPAAKAGAQDKPATSSKSLASTKPSPPSVLKVTESNSLKPTVKRSRNKKDDVAAPANEDSFCGFEWLKLIPKGIVFEGHHFVMILEDKEKQIQLPIRFPLQSGDMISVPNMVSVWRKSLSTIQDKFFPMLNLQLKRCVFVPHEGEQHRVKVFFIKDGIEKFLESDLDRILGLCLEAKLPFYATRSYIQQAKTNAGENEIFLQNQRWTDGRQKYLM